MAALAYAPSPLTLTSISVQSRSQISVSGNQSAHYFQQYKPKTSTGESIVRTYCRRKFVHRKTYKATVVAFCGAVHLDHMRMVQFALISCVRKIEIVHHMRLNESKSNAGNSISYRSEISAAGQDIGLYR
jgi:hypothetical protein